MVTSYARSSSSIKARYLDPQTSFILWTRSSVRQANRIQLEFSKASMNAKRALRQLFWRSTDLTFLQIIIVANRPTLPFSWGGGRRFVTGRRQIKDRCRETMDLHQALQTSDKSTATASYAFNHIPNTFRRKSACGRLSYDTRWFHQLYHLSTRFSTALYKASPGNQLRVSSWLYRHRVCAQHSTQHSTQHSASTFDIATFDDRHAITISYLN